MVIIPRFCLTIFQMDLKYSVFAKKMRDFRAFDVKRATKPLQWVSDFDNNSWQAGDIFGNFGPKMDTSGMFWFQSQITKIKGHIKEFTRTLATFPSFNRWKAYKGYLIPRERHWLAVGSLVVENNPFRISKTSVGNYFPVE